MQERASNPLRNARETRGLTQVELAARSGVALSKLRQAEVTGLITAKMARRIARALHAPAEERLAWREAAVARRAERLVAENPAGLFALISAVKSGRRLGEIEAPCAPPESPAEVADVAAEDPRGGMSAEVADVAAEPRDDSEAAAPDLVQVAAREEEAP